MVDRFALRTVVPCKVARGLDAKGASESGPSTLRGWSGCSVATAPSVGLTGLIGAKATGFGRVRLGCADPESGFGRSGWNCGGQSGISTGGGGFSAGGGRRSAGARVVSAAGVWISGAGQATSPAEPARPSAESTQARGESASPCAETAHRGGQWLAGGDE
jgi:hypothetical protein